MTNSDIFNTLINFKYENYFNMTAEEKLEATRMKKFYYEYFIERIGAANVQLVGSSIKSTATDASKNGLAYRIYSCGIYGEDGDKNNGSLFLEN